MKFTSGAAGASGNGDNSQAQVHIEVTNPKKTYFGGDVVEGSVYLNVQKDMSLSPGALTVMFSGEEHTKTHWKTTTGSGKNKKTKHHTRHRSRNVVSVPVTLETFRDGGGMRIQKKVYPFQVRSTLALALTLTLTNPNPNPNHNSNLHRSCFRM